MSAMYISQMDSRDAVGLWLRLHETAQTKVPHGDPLSLDERMLYARITERLTREAGEPNPSKQTAHTVAVVASALAALTTLDDDSSVVASEFIRALSRDGFAVIEANDQRWIVLYTGTAGPEWWELTGTREEAIEFATMDNSHLNYGRTGYRLVRGEVFASAHKDS